MKIIILGCGRVGSSLANILSLEGHDIVTIDKNSEVFKRLGKTFKGISIVGHGFDKAVLEKAGIEHCDAFVSVTSGDNTNIVSARVARDEYRVPKVIARIYDPVRAKIYRNLGIITVSPVTWAANKIKDLLIHPEQATQLTFGSGEVEIMRVEIPHHIIGKDVQTITIPGQIQVIVITRLGKAFIPSLGTVFEEGDVARLIVARSALSQLDKFIHHR